jgi:hypothetical protein
MFHLSAISRSDNRKAGPSDRTCRRINFPSDIGRSVLSASFVVLLFYPEDGCSTFLGNVGELLQEPQIRQLYMISNKR